MVVVVSNGPSVFSSFKLKLNLLIDMGIFVVVLSIVVCCFGKNNANNTTTIIIIKMKIPMYMFVMFVFLG